MNTIEAIKAMKSGRAISRPNYDKCFMFMKGKSVCFYNFYDRKTKVYADHENSFCIDEILVDDWYLIA